MARSCAGLGALLSIIAIAGCGADPADDSRSGREVEAVTRGQEGSAQPVRACGLLDLAAATRVIGSGTEHLGEDEEELTCLYSNPGVATLNAQLGTAELYEQITIMQPHTSVEIGGKGRYNVQETGAVAVQFAKGAYSMTLSVQPIGTSETAYLERLLSAAREAASRMP